jgi:hypothetical protein
LWLTFTGDWNCDQKEGEGVWISSSRDVYKGSFKAGNFHGFGIYFMAKTGDKYYGDWEDGWKHGNGVYRWKDGSTYDGNYAHGARTGFGTFRWGCDGSEYSGYWKHGQKHGKGVYTDIIGKKMNQEWNNDVRVV